MVATTLLACAVAFVAPARGEEEAAEPKAKKPVPRQYTGFIESIDAAAKTLTVKHSKKDETTTFTLTEDCKFMTAEKEDATIDNFKVGDKVLCKYRDVDGKLMCHRVLHPKAKEKKETEEKETKE
jgi:Cu/Ag efflux protein CusF